MSSVAKETIRDRFKIWKFLVFPTSTANFHFSVFIKRILPLICTLASMTFFFYFAFSGTQSNPIAALRYHKNIDVTSKDNRTNISHLLFGIGGAAATWSDRRHYTDVWWQPGLIRGYVWLDEKPSEDRWWPRNSPEYKISEDTSKFRYSCWYGNRSALRMTRILKESFELGLDDVRWFVMGDDDTVFFTENLVTVLAKYDHDQMYYIGGISESVEQLVIHSYDMAYGGGGFAISYPLARELVRILDGCIDRYEFFYGSDQKIQGCLSEIGVPITKELGFHQLDIRGDPYGILAAHPLAPLVSLHHLDYVQPLFPKLNQIESVKKLVNAYKMDPSRALQHSFCYDLQRNWSISVSWDYTVQLYPSLVYGKELDTAFLTFQSWKSWSNEPFTFNTRVMSSDPCGKPIIYFLDGNVRSHKGKTVTTYKRYAEEGNKCDGRYDYTKAFAVQYFKVSAPKFNPKLWTKAPRRQCCEVMNGTRSGNNVVEVKIRRCNLFESVTPP